MKLFSIVRLTLKLAIRSHIFKLMLLILISLIFLLPNIIIDDGTTSGFIQIILKYNLNSISFLLSLSTIWLGCFVITQDMENYQLHLLVAKPISRTTIWIGKMLSVFIINLTLLIIAVFTVYWFIIWQFNNREFLEGNNEKNKRMKDKIHNEVLIARRVYTPKYKNLKEEAIKTVENILKKGKSNIPNNLKENTIKKTLANLKARQGEVRFKQTKTWVFEGLPTDYKGYLYFRYKPNIFKVQASDQRPTRAGLSVFINQKNMGNNVLKIEKKRLDKLMCDTYHTERLQSPAILPNGTVKISYTNLDYNGSSIIFPISEGPKLLINATSFENNLVRGTFVIALQLFCLAGVVCAVSALFHLPTSIFFTGSYYLLSNFLLADLMLSNPIDISSSLANGELIELSFLGKLIFTEFILKGIPIFLLGIYFYNKRELGLIMKK